MLIAHLEDRAAMQWLDCEHEHWEARYYREFDPCSLALCVQSPMVEFRRFLFHHGLIHAWLRAWYDSR